MYEAPMCMSSDGLKVSQQTSLTLMTGAWTVHVKLHKPIFWKGCKYKCGVSNTQPRKADVVACFTISSKRLLFYSEKSCLSTGWVSLWGYQTISPSWQEICLNPRQSQNTPKHTHALTQTHTHTLKALTKQQKRREKQTAPCLGFKRDDEKVRLHSCKRSTHIINKSFGQKLS